MRKSELITTTHNQIEASFPQQPLYKPFDCFLLCYSCCTINYKCQTLCEGNAHGGRAQCGAGVTVLYPTIHQKSTPLHLTLAFNVCIRSFIHKSIVFCMILTGRELKNVKPCTADTCLETRTRSYSSTDDGISYSLLTCATCFFLQLFFS